MRVCGAEITDDELAELWAAVSRGSVFFYSQDVRQEILSISGPENPVDNHWWASEAQNRICQKWRRAGLIESRSPGLWRVIV